MPPILPDDEIAEGINLMLKLGFSDEELNNLSYQELCNLLDNDPVLVGEYFQYKFEVFLKKSYLMAH